jgi:Tol biopolymer transport system component
MERIHSVHWIIVLDLLLSGCSINVPQPSAAAPKLQNEAAPTVLAAPPSSNAGSTSGKRVGNPALPSTTIPVAWSNLNLTGKLVYTSSIQSANSLVFSIQALDLQNGNIATIFQAPNNSWIDFVSVSPDGTQLIMAYLPPRDNSSSTKPGQQALYTLPLDGSQPPQLLFQPPSDGDQYYQPVWSPDGKYIYFAHVDYNAPPKVQGQHYAYYEIYRMAYPGGQPQKIADQAYWPRLSDDGARLAFVTLSPLDGSNQLYVANADGSGAYQVALSGLYVPPIIDAPFFTPDDQFVLYSAVTPTQSYQTNWLERLLGIIVASAHTVPSDWWSVPIGGGTPTQLTHIAAVGLYASLSPDKKYIASYSGSGLFVMKPDGTGLTVLINDMGGLAGTVDWIP